MAPCNTLDDRATQLGTPALWPAACGAGSQGAPCHGIMWLHAMYGHFDASRSMLNPPAPEGAWSGSWP